MPVTAPASELQAANAAADLRRHMALLAPQMRKTSAPGRLGHVGMNVIWAIAVLAMAAQGSEIDAGAISIAALQDKISPSGRVIASFRVEGVVCAVVPQRKWIALQDGSAALLLEVGALDGSLRVGDRAAVTGRNCAIDQSRFATELGVAPTVDVDGIHSVITKAGVAYLAAGLQPVRLSWFNGRGASALKLEYEGPSLSRRSIPDHALWRSRGAGAQNGSGHGLDFTAYVGSSWSSVDDLAGLAPAAHGVARNFDRACSVRTEDAGLIFTGYLEIPAAGIYTFHLESDDGARFSVGDPAIACQIISLEGKSAPEARPLDEALSAQNHAQWVTAEGGVLFAAEDKGNLALDLGWKGEILPVVVVDGASLLARGLAQRHVRVTGLWQTLGGPGPRPTSRLTIPCPEFVAVDSNAMPPPVEKILSTTEEVASLTPEEADRPLRVKIPGVVTWSSVHSLMLQDATGGVFVLVDRGLPQPTVGERWEAEGITGSGEFAPVLHATGLNFLGQAGLPNPIHATWDQLVNGSLDMQYVELQGVLTAATEAELTLLTRGGSIKIRDHLSYPLPKMLSPAARAQAHLGSVLRIRGVLSVEADRKTRESVPGVIRLGSALVSEEEPRPADPFAIGLKKASDLLRFDPRASIFERTKLAGQIICRRPGKYFMADGKTGVQLLSKNSTPQPGDLVEAVGFPQVGGSSLALQEAELHVTGHAALPEPVFLSPEHLLERQRHATLVCIEATLLEEGSIQDERVLQLLAGRHRFIARAPADGDRPPKPLRPGSRLALTGVYALRSESRGNEAPDGFELLLNDMGAITVLQPGPWWTKQRVLAVAAAAIGGLAGAAVWIALLRRQVEDRTKAWQKEVGQRQLAEQRRAVEEERARVAQDLHDELGVGLTQIGILGQLVNDPLLPTTRKNLYADQLTDAARSMVAGLDEIVWAVNPHYDSVASLADYYEIFAQRFLEMVGIECRFDTVNAAPEWPLDAQFRHGVFLAFKEALNNVVRHSGATEVRLKIEATERQLMITIQDNGCGFDPTVAAPGNDGLAGMRRRLENLGGACTVVSDVGRGATVEFLLPLGRRQP